MDFARKQLEKYGWIDGKGLGKNENGISQALKPKLKRSVTGVGHDPASEFNEHWWTTLYDKAASNVQVKETNGKTKKIKTKDDFTITNNMWQMKRNSKKGGKEQYSDYFVRTAVMSGASKTENVKDTELEEEVETKEVYRMTDEELFAACEGRTAHKGARHGLKAIGKLARIAKQEEILLSQSKYNGYSHAKKRKENTEDVIEEVTFKSEEEPKRKKKKKRKRCVSNENRNCEFEETELAEAEAMGEDEKGDVIRILQYESIEEIDKFKEPVKDVNVTEDNIRESKKKRKRKDIEAVETAMEVDNIVQNMENVSDEKVKKKKKKKLKSTTNFLV